VFHRKIADFEKGGQQEKDKIEFLETRLKEAEKEEDIGSIHFQLGETCYKISDNEKALYHWQKAKSFCKKLKDQRNLCAALGNIGLVYKAMGELESALKYLSQALEIDRKIGYLQGKASDLGNIGLVYQAMGDLESALKYLGQAKAIFEKIGMINKAEILGKWIKIRNKPRKSD